MSVRVALWKGRGAEGRNTVTNRRLRRRRRHHRRPRRPFVHRALAEASCKIKSTILTHCS